MRGRRCGFGRRCCCLWFSPSPRYSPPTSKTRSGFGGAWFQQAVRNGIHIGLWLSGAYLIVALLNHLFWEGFVAHLLQHPVPRLVRDSVAIVVFLLAAAGIIGLEFGQPVVGIWATSGAIGIILGIALRSIILDIFSGLAINFEHSYRIGDWVELVERNALPFAGKSSRSIGEPPGCRPRTIASSSCQTAEWAR